MRLARVTSSNIQAIGYEPSPGRADGTLVVMFASGAAYRYRAVPARVHDRLLTAASKGAYFAREIRPAYPAERLAPEELAGLEMVP